MRDSGTRPGLRVALGPATRSSPDPASDRRPILGRWGTMTGSWIRRFEQRMGRQRETWGQEERGVAVCDIIRVRRAKTRITRSELATSPAPRVENGWDRAVPS